MEEKFMQAAMQLVENTIDKNQGGPFGAVVVKDGEIVGQGINSVTALNDPTAHAEIQTIRNACHNLKTFDLSGCEMYVTCEPCPMCLFAIYWARIEKVFFAATRDDAAAIGFDDAKFYDEINDEVDKKKVPMNQSVRAKAVALFKRWSEKTDKVMY